MRLAGRFCAGLRSFKRHARLKDMVLLRNKPPRWNEQLGAYCLNFSGRVTAASVKNFQLVEEGDASERVVLQYGKVRDEKMLQLFACLQRHSMLHAWRWWSELASRSSCSGVRLHC